MTLREWLAEQRAQAPPGQADGVVSAALQFWRDHAFDDLRCDEAVIRDERALSPYRDRPELRAWEAKLKQQWAERRAEVAATLQELEAEGWRLLPEHRGTGRRARRPR